MRACVAHILRSSIEGRCYAWSLTLGERCHMRAWRVGNSWLYISLVQEGFREHGREGRDVVGC